MVIAEILSRTWMCISSKGNCFLFVHIYRKSLLSWLARKESSKGEGSELQVFAHVLSFCLEDTLSKLKSYTFDALGTAQTIHQIKWSDHPEEKDFLETI